MMRTRHVKCSAVCRAAFGRVQRDFAREQAPTRYIWAVGLRFYVASSLGNADAASTMIAALKAEGHLHTYNWCEHGAVFREDATRDANVQKMDETASAEAEGVASAEVVIAMLPGGKGTHVELGMALALKKPVFLVSEQDPYDAGQRHNGGRDYPCAFWFHPLVQRICGATVPTLIDQTVAAVRQLTMSLRASPKAGTLLSSLFDLEPLDYSEQARLAAFSPYA